MVLIPSTAPPIADRVCPILGSLVITLQLISTSANRDGSDSKILL